MKKFLRPFIVLASAFALFVANSSSMACYVWVFREPKMPASLVKRD